MTDIQDRLDEVLYDRKQQAILDWLTSVDYSTQQNDFIARRQEGTGGWLVGSDEFQQWENSRGGILFCPGIPGSGKTMMVSIVVWLMRRQRVGGYRVALQIADSEEPVVTPPTRRHPR